MPSKNLTDRFLAGDPAASNYFDTKVKGLTLRVTAAGGKLWSFVYRVQGRGPQWISLGSYPALKLADARAKATDHRRAVDDGRDPIAERKAAEAIAQTPPPPAAPVFTIATLCKLYIGIAKGLKKTWYDDERTIKRYVLPAWQDRAVRSITRADVHELLDAAATKGLKGGVNQLQMLVSRLFTIALDRGLVDAHPVARMIKRHKVKARSRVLSDAEIRILREQLDTVPGEAADVIWLRLLLGQRAEETAGMLWTEVDLEARTWFLDGERTKNSRPHLLALPDSAVVILKARQDARTTTTEARVFPLLTTVDASEAGSRAHGVRTIAAIAASFPAFDWRDLRRTFATRLAGLGVGEDTIGRLLNHAKYGVTGKHYNQYKYLPEKQVALATWDRELTRILKNEPKTSNVIPMPAR